MAVQRTQSGFWTSLLILACGGGVVAGGQTSRAQLPDAPSWINDPARPGETPAAGLPGGSAAAGAQTASPAFKGDPTPVAPLRATSPSPPVIAWPARYKVFMTPQQGGMAGRPIEVTAALRPIGTWDGRVRETWYVSTVADGDPRWTVYVGADATGRVWAGCHVKALAYARRGSGFIPVEGATEPYDGTYERTEQLANAIKPLRYTVRIEQDGQPLNLHGAGEDPLLSAVPGAFCPRVQTAWRAWDWEAVKADAGKVGGLFRIDTAHGPRTARIDRNIATSGYDPRATFALSANWYDGVVSGQGGEYQASRSAFHDWDMMVSDAIRAGEPLDRFVVPLRTQVEHALRLPTLSVGWDTGAHRMILPTRQSTMLLLNPVAIQQGQTGYLQPRPFVHDASHLNNGGYVAALASDDPYALLLLQAQGLFALSEVPTPDQITMLQVRGLGDALARLSLAMRLTPASAPAFLAPKAAISGRLRSGLTQHARELAGGPPLSRITGVLPRYFGDAQIISTKLPMITTSVFMPARLMAGVYLARANGIAEAGPLLDATTRHIALRWHVGDVRINCDARTPNGTWLPLAPQVNPGQINSPQAWIAWVRRLPDPAPKCSNNYPMQILSATRLGADAQKRGWVSDQTTRIVEASRIAEAWARQAFIEDPLYSKHFLAAEQGPAKAP